MILKNKERYAPYLAKIILRVSLLLTLLLLARRWPDPHPEPSRAVAVLDEIRARKHVPSLRLASPARLKGQEDTPWSPAQEIVAVEKG